MIGMEDLLSEIRRQPPALGALAALRALEIDVAAVEDQRPPMAERPAP
jgi:hypothetical protein